MKTNTTILKRSSLESPRTLETNKKIILFIENKINQINNNEIIQFVYAQYSTNHITF